MVEGSVSDPVGDLLIRLKNASSARLDTTFVPKSRLLSEILSILKQAQMIAGFKDKEIKGKKAFEVFLLSGRQSVRKLKRVSTPGRRFYVKAHDIPRPLMGKGLVVLSTSKGVLSGKDAYKKGVGGEIMITESQ